MEWYLSQKMKNVRRGRHCFCVQNNPQVLFHLFPQGKIPQDGLIPVDTISKEDVTLILDHWLQRKERKLTPEQKDLLLNSYDQCPLPLYLNLCFLETSKWTSYMDMSNLQLYKTVREAINGLFAKLERSHGQIFVSKTLGYLTAGMFNDIFLSSPVLAGMA